MRGWLVVNSFLDTKKFSELYGFLSRAASDHQVELEIKATDELTDELGADFTAFDLPDFVLFWDKDVYLARRLEQSGLRLFNSADAVRICDNKILTGMALNHRLPMPKTVIAPKTFEHVNYCRKDFLTRAEAILGYPMIIKEACGSFGQQVYLAGSRREAEEIIDRLGWKEFLMQEFIAGSAGRDIRVNVVGGRAVSAMLRHNDRDFRSNISNGGSAEAYRLSDLQAQTAVEACKLVGADFAGVDLLFGPDGGPLVCEVNSNPHFKSSLDCTGIDVSQLILGEIVRCLR